MDIETYELTQDQIDELNELVQLEEYAETQA